MLPTYFFNNVIIIRIWRNTIPEGIIDLKTDEYDLTAVTVINRMQYVQVQSKYMLQSRCSITLPPPFSYYYYYWIIKYKWVY